MVSTGRRLSLLEGALTLQVDLEKTPLLESIGIVAISVEEQVREIRAHLFAATALRALQVDRRGTLPWNPDHEFSGARRHADLMLGIVSNDVRGA